MGDPVERHERYLEDRLIDDLGASDAQTQELVILLISLAFTVAVGVAVIWAGVSLATRGRRQPQGKDVSIRRAPSAMLAVARRWPAPASAAIRRASVGPHASSGEPGRSQRLS